ncbi:MAG: VWA domain-containing protein [Candidatus Cloacimonetes bacterium]|nr:VWA domain-containing protein [Candidatus Cloacimonadota bacterium]
MLEYFKPLYLWGILIVIPYLIWEIFYKDRHRVRFIHNRTRLLRKIGGYSSWLRFLPVIMRTLLIASLFIVLARPRLAHKQQEVKGQGIDIILAIDVSGSMKAVDFQPVNRLEAAKKVAKEFIEKRVNDRMGVIVFSDHAFTICPLTLDYNMLMAILDKTAIDEEGQGTAIGMGLATAVARLKDSQAKSKVIILITDGRNNAGEIDPLTAANLAKTLGIKVYAIGVGRKGLVDYPYGNGYRKVNIEIDLDMLNSIAEACGTQKARQAKNTEELIEIMNYIDNMEKTEINVKNYYEYEELFPLWLLFAVTMLLLELLLRFFIIKQLP